MYLSPDLKCLCQRIAGNLLSYQFYSYLYHISHRQHLLTFFGVSATTDVNLNYILCLVVIVLHYPYNSYCCQVFDLFGLICLLAGLYIANDNLPTLWRTTAGCLRVAGQPDSALRVTSSQSTTNPCMITAGVCCGISIACGRKLLSYIRPITDRINLINSIPTTESIMGTASKSPLYLGLASETNTIFIVAY